MTNLEKIICEAEYNGDIDIELRDQLLDVLDESSDDILSRYDSMKEVIFEKELCGEISLSERDSLLYALEEKVSEYMESGGARIKYIKTLADKQERIKDEMRRVKKLYDTAASSESERKYYEQFKRLENEYASLADQASLYSHRVENGNIMYAKNISRALKDKKLMHSLDRDVHGLLTKYDRDAKNRFNSNYEDKGKPGKANLKIPN